MSVWLRCVLPIVVALLAGLCSATSAAADTGREPVLLIHGWRGSVAQFDTMRAALEREGYPVYVVDLPGDENLANARTIADVAERARRAHGHDRVSLVGHSMGGLSARHYLRFLGGTDTTRGYISMGTGQRGYAPACLLAPDQGGQMCPVNPFIIQLNTGDPTPAPVTYTFLNSSRDATRHDVIGENWCRAEIPDVEHADEPGDPKFIAAVRDALVGRCPA
ncbi:alpha/beta fold hydrolase [Nocardia otitidiscaviarum]|uniref:esterase/lipase family protein n=1 Tax=Nocardia otitidiscaviarum TaxID=1823 RepID=UPI0011DCA3C6|nr:alpha/beta fold hydrolase [Nocardia otitidiscaviarum]MBF6135073.1 alpha/beta fold hydrolase [Nocardia otitidiscaviarum]MBF6486895.1 alpha/beta fold hydrolase [Nocardia otitidiscaviarum]